MTYEFTLIVEGPDLLSDACADALFEAGCDDALIGVSEGVQYVEFERDAESLHAAVMSAVRAVESLDGAAVVRIADAGLVSMADIAGRTGRTRESVRLLVAGRRGPGGFPPPVTAPDARYRLWRWSAVRAWFAGTLDEVVVDPDAHVIEAINAGLELRRHAQYVSEECRLGVRELAGLWQTDEN